MPAARRSKLLADVQARRGTVVLTASPDQARAVATTVGGRTVTASDAPMDEWLDDMVHSLAAIAARLDLPQVSRGDFLRGGWVSPPSPAAGAPSVVSKAVAVATGAKAGWYGEPAELPVADTSGAAGGTVESVVVAAVDTAGAAAAARAARSVAGALAVGAASGLAVQTAASVQLRADVTAARIATAAQDAAFAATAGPPAVGPATALTALLVQASVKADAVVVAEETALAAAAVATAVAEAAAQAATTAATAAVSFETEVVRAASALQAVATECARLVALQTGGRRRTELTAPTRASAAVEPADIAPDSAGYDVGRLDRLPLELSDGRNGEVERSAATPVVRVTADA